MFLRFRIRAYLFFSLAFYIGVVNRIIYYIQDDYVASYYSPIAKSTFYLLTAATIHAFTDFKPHLRKVLFILGILLFSLTEFILLTGSLPLGIVGIADETYRLTLSLVLINANTREKYLVNNFRTKLIRLVFLIIGVLLLYLSLSRLYLFSSATMGNNEILLETYQTRDLIWATIGLLTAFGGMFFPELFLITHSQISYVSKLYDQIPVQEPAEEVGTDHLLEYLKTLPKDLLEKTID